MADKTALETIKGIIEDNGGTSDAETIVPALEDLGKVIATGGGGGSVPDGSVTTAKLANNAVTNDKLALLAVGRQNIQQNAVGSNQLADGAVTIDKIDSIAKKELASNILYAADATTAQTLAALGFTATVLTPKDARSTSPHMNIRSMLCWIDTASGYLEKAPIGFSGNLQSQTITLWAKGLYSTASGILGVDTSWTITALPTDVDGVSY